MKRNTAIVAAVLAVIVVVAAVGGWWLLSNPGGDSGGNGGGTVPDDNVPGGPEGTVNGIVINFALNQSNASAYDELLAIFDRSTNDSVEVPDALVLIAVSNNMTEDLELNLANFTAETDNGSQVQALNKDNVTIEPNVTAYRVLGFRTNGTNVTSVAYTGDDIELDTMTIMSNVDRTMEPPMMMDAPTNLTEIDNLTFEALNTWRIEQRGLSPIPLFFNESENVILALVLAENSNTTTMDLSATNFWLDLGNGTWVQAEQAKNHNLPSTLEADTTKAFLIGFRVDGMTEPEAIVFWPDQGTNATVRFEISVEAAPAEPGSLMISKVWTQPSNNTTGSILYIELMGEGAEDVELSAWSQKQGEMNAQPAPETNNTTGSVYTFELDSGDRLVLLRYDDGGQTRYLWLRPLVAP